MQTEPFPEEFTPDVDSHTLALWEMNARQTEKYKTRYIFAPFMDAPCSQVPSGYIPEGEIYVLASPKGKINAKLLPEGAQILMLVGADRGIPPAIDPRAPAPSVTPEIAALTQRIKDLEGRNSASA